MSAESPAAGMLSDPARLGGLAVLTLAHAVGTLNIMAVLAMGPVVQDALGLSRGGFGLLVAAYHAGLIAGALPFGWLVDRIGARRALIAAKLLLATGTAILSQTDDFTLAAPALAVAGLGYALINPATAQGVLLLFPAETRATAMSIKQTGVPIGGALAAAVGAAVVLFGWRANLLVVAALTASAALATLALPSEARRSEPVPVRHAVADLARVVRNRNLTLLNLSSCGYHIAQGAFFAYLTLFLREAGQATLPFASMCLGIAHVTAVAGRIAWGMVSDRLFHGRRKAAIVLMGLLSAAVLMAAPLVGPGAVLVAGPLLALLLGLTIAAYAGVFQTAVVEAADARLAGAAIGYNMFIVPMASMVGPPLFGAVVDGTGSYTPAWLLVGALALTSALAIARLFRERRR